MASTGPAVFPSQPVTSSFAGLFPGSTDYPGATDYTGDVITTANNLYPGVTTFAGQGNLPLLDVYISFLGVSTSPPVWTWVSPNKVRQFSISRTEGETGTATLVLDNRNRDFDSTFVSSPYYPNVRPLNKIWLRAQFVGETNDMFVGYAESYEQQWPGGGWSDAITIVKASDEMKILALSTLPRTNPPRASYADVVAFDNPQAYYPLEAVQDLTAAPVITQDSPASPGAGGEDTFELGQLAGKTPTRKHHLKPIGRKAPPKKKRAKHHGRQPDKRK